MRTGLGTFLVLIATAIFACGGDELPAVSDPPTQPQQATEAPAQREDEERPSSGQQTRPPEAGRSAESGRDAETGEVEKEPPPDDSSGDETAIQEPEREAGETNDAALEAEAEDAEAEDAEPESEEEPEDLTDVPAVVMKDADVHVRPGLSWPVIGRLSAGEEVAVLSAAGGWFRISFGDDREGWIRTPALDLGEVETRSIPREPAPGIVAEWQGAQYGVMGQSADGAEIRLLPMEDELAEMVSAPIDQVTLLADDITVHDLPILIGDETVVFPGDDFRVGQGRILPKANEWMWLPWGWLLAHNDSHIWQWRPETDELEFARRPPGEASLSPDGRNLAILTCGGIESCNATEEEDVKIMPLDGAATISLRRQLNKAGRLDDLRAIVLTDTNDLSWSRDGAALLVSVLLESASIATLPAVRLDASGAMTVFEWQPEGVLADKDCYPMRYPYRARYEHQVYWGFDSHNNVRVRVGCTEDAEFSSGWAVYSRGGDLLRLEPDPESPGPASDEVVQTAAGADQLGEDYQILWSTSGEHALIVAPETMQLWLYDAQEDHVRSIAGQSDALHPDLWEVIEIPGYVDWNTYWAEDRWVVVVPRKGHDWAIGPLFVDTSEATGVAFHHGLGTLWPCIPSAAWSPHESLFHFGFEEDDLTSATGMRLLVDGTAAARRLTLHRYITHPDGSLIASFRSLGGGQFETPLHRSEWSRDGARFAVGGHQSLGTCRPTR